MKRSVLSLLFFLITISIFAQDKKADWVKVTDSAGWRPRDSQGEVVYKNQLWILGGWFDSYETPPRDVWSSPNGKNWKLVNQFAPWKHSDLAMSIAFKGKMWMMGGWYNGRLEKHSASDDVWSSQDGKNWKQETDSAGWTPRIASALVEFKGKMWILGGTADYYFGDQNSYKNDVWSSSDGKNWQLMTSDAGWSPRAYHQAVVLNGKIYVFGGGTYLPEFATTSDVWSSEDGENWTKISDKVPWSGRLWFTSAVYRDRIWVMGGWSQALYKNWGDVWYSKDGKNWKELKSDVKWKQRHEPSSFVFQDKLWMVGGKSGPGAGKLVNDVWYLKLPKDW